MRTSDFDYELPKNLIAQHPSEPRDSARLMVLHRQSGQIDHRVFSDIVEYLAKPDCLVVNETRVLPARLFGRKAGSGGAVEVLLLRQRWKGAWEALVRPGRRIHPGDDLEFDDRRARAKVVKRVEGGARLLQFLGEVDVIELAHRIGEVPLPPYVHEPLDDPEKYQTVYARSERSAAAPTAGLHFTAELLARLDEMGVALAKVDLDVGLDTFRPVTEEQVEDHVIHRERFEVSESAVRLVEQARARGGKVVCVGTTSVRALESAAGEDGALRATAGHTDIFITPGWRFRATDALVTNFHLPRTTLLMLVCAFAGRDLVLSAYRTAVEERYRFYSFGDAMLIL